MTKPREDPERERLRRLAEEANQPPGPPDLAAAKPGKAPRIRGKP